MNLEQIFDGQFVIQAQFPQCVSEYTQYAGCYQGSSSFFLNSVALAPYLRTSNQKSN